MNKKKLLLVLIPSLFILEALYFFGTVPVVKASNVPDEQKYLSFNEEYTYNVTQFDSHATWTNLDWMPPAKGVYKTNPGGQIKVKFTRFGDKDPNDYTCFSEPLPYIDIEIYENVLNTLELNFSLSNIPNSEASMNLAISYKAFLSGFLIPTENLTKLKEQANEQVDPSGWMPGTVDIKETNCSITFNFKADDKSQNITMIYDKWLGTLLWTKLENSYGPDLEIFLAELEGYDILSPSPSDDDDDDKKEQAIPSFPLIILFSIITAITIIYILRINFKIKIQKY